MLTEVRGHGTEVIYSNSVQGYDFRDERTRQAAKMAHRVRIFARLTHEFSFYVDQTSCDLERQTRTNLVCFI